MLAGRISASGPLRSKQVDILLCRKQAGEETFGLSTKLSPVEGGAGVESKNLPRGYLALIAAMVSWRDADAEAVCPPPTPDDVAAYRAAALAYRSAWRIEKRNGMKASAFACCSARRAERNARADVAGSGNLCAACRRLGRVGA